MNSMFIKHVMSVGPYVTAWLSILVAVKRLERKLVMQQKTGTEQKKYVEQMTNTEETMILRPFSAKLYCSKFTETCDDFLVLNSEACDNVITVFDNVTADEWCYDKNIVIVNDYVNLHTILEEMHLKKTTLGLVYKDQILIGILNTSSMIRYILRHSSCMSTSAKKMLQSCVVASKYSRLNDICRLMCSGMRYMAVECHDDSENEHTIISQRALVKKILDTDERTDLLRKTLVKDIVINEKKIKTCYNTMTAKEAFQIMAAYDITSLPVVDFTNFEALGVISATDILYVRHDIESLNENVMVFLQNSRQDACISRAANNIISCGLNDPLRQVLEAMLHENIHHIYVLSDDNHPSNVISFVDILRFMFP